MLEKDIKYFRCLVDQRILTNRMIHNGECVGHRLGIAGYVTFMEWMKIKLFIAPREWLLLRSKGILEKLRK